MNVLSKKIDFLRVLYEFCTRLFFELYCFKNIWKYILKNMKKAINMDYQSQESAEHLCQKHDNYAKAWQPIADKL